MQISYVQPNLGGGVKPFIKNIGTSNHDHGTNQIAFLDDGRLIWGTGSNTNAGIKDNKIGGLDVRFSSLFLFFSKH